MCWLSCMSFGTRQIMRRPARHQQHSASLSAGTYSKLSPFFKPPNLDKIMQFVLWTTTSVWFTEKLWRLIGYRRVAIYGTRCPPCLRVSVLATRLTGRMVILEADLCGIIWHVHFSWTENPSFPAAINAELLGSQNNLAGDDDSIWNTLSDSVERSTLSESVFQLGTSSPAINNQDINIVFVSYNS